MTNIPASVIERCSEALCMASNTDPNKAPAIVKQVLKAAHYDEVVSELEFYRNQAKNKQLLPFTKMIKGETK